MKRKSIKKKLAVLLAVLMMLPTQPVMAAGVDAMSQKEQRSDETSAKTEEKETENVADGEESKVEGTKDEIADAAEEEKSEDGKTEKEITEEVSGGENPEEGKIEEGNIEDVTDKEESEKKKDEDESVGEVKDEEESKEEKTENEETQNVAVEDENSKDKKSESRDKKSVDSNNTEDASEEDVFDNEILEEDIEDGILEDRLLLKASSSNALRRKPQELVIYNTGNAEISVVSYEDFTEYELGDAYFEEDGSFTINIPEENPFFPYEVQFTCDGETTTEWFMTPDDMVEIDGHTFGVSAYFDETVVTQMSLEIGGETVVVYPERKKFTNDGGSSMFSLMPLTKVDDLTVDLTGFSPIELTRVRIGSIFAGQVELQDTDKIIWKREYGNGSYKVSAQGDLVDLSYETWHGGTSWEMIVGEANQLEKSNIRYIIQVNTSNSLTWLQPTAYAQNEDGSRKQIQMQESHYYDDYNDDRHLRFPMLSDEIENLEIFYVGLDLDNENFDRDFYDQVKVYEGRYTSEEEVEAANDITNQILSKDMTAIDAGYPLDIHDDPWITFVAYDSVGKEVGCLPVELDVYRVWTCVGARLYTNSGDQASEDHFAYSQSNRYRVFNFELDKGYAVDGIYHLVLTYNKADEMDSKQVTGAFIGKYESLEAAKAAGVKDVKDSLFTEGVGYPADFSKGVYVTVFTGEDENAEQDMYTACFMTEGWVYEPNVSVDVAFIGLHNKDGESVECNVINTGVDDYGDDNFVTILLDENEDLTQLAPVFSCEDNVNLYAPGSKKPEVSGESFHDFSKGAIQFTSSLEDGNEDNSKNYWLRVIQPAKGQGLLYINSLSDPDAETRIEDGVTYSKREMFVDGRYDYKHDIHLINVGTEPLEKLSVELESDQVELDEYWTLTGENDLSGFTGFKYDDTWNQAKLRLVPKEGAADGREISGTLTIKAGETPLMVLTLTGVVGDPSIITTDIPDAVKYVHYGTMIQNSNKYDFNTTNYRLLEGSLPNGMVLRPNGELYGVPTEIGEFKFKVQMENSYNEFNDSEAEFTLVVIENTDENVDNATDTNYELKERVPDIALNDYRDYTMTSIGEFDEWVNLYLDGKLLVEGVDYEAKSGSTSTTMKSQTLKAGNTVGTHTISMEFRTGEAVMKRAAQNYKVTEKRKSGGGGSGRRSSSGSSSSNQANDPKKGHVNSQSGIVTGEGSGYSHWSQDENGWKLIYADGTMAAGSMIQQADGTQVEQVLWEKINGSYYAFNVNGYLSVGWVYDYLLNEWYYVFENSGMVSGWYHEDQDGYTYYLDPVNGALAHGWKEIEGKWYYLNEVFKVPTWDFDSESKTWFYSVASGTRPWGAMYRNETTPDGYQVDEDGAWNGSAQSLLRITLPGELSGG